MPLEFAIEPSVVPSPIWSVPAEIVVAPVYVFAPVRTSLEVVLFWVTPVTFVPITELIVAVPVPVPLFVIEPVMLTGFDVMETLPLPLAALMRVRLPEPVNPPLIVVLPSP